MNTQTTTWSRFIQLMALVFVLVAVSACSKKEGSKASVRNRGRTGAVTQNPNQVPGTQSTGGAGQIFNFNQTQVSLFLSPEDPSSLGTVQKIYVSGRVGDGNFGSSMGGYVEIRIVDSLAYTNGGDILVRFEDCSLLGAGNNYEVSCRDDYGGVSFRGTANAYNFTGNVMFTSGGSTGSLGTFNVPTCSMIEC